MRGTRAHAAIGPKAQELIPSWSSERAIRNLTSIASYRRNGGDGRRRSKPLVFEDDQSVWRAIFDGQPAIENRTVELRDFCVSEWMPLRPGLYHTTRAGFAREDALINSQIRADDRRAPKALVRAIVEPQGRDHVRIFSPEGKRGMIDGGIGCVRLKPLPERRTHPWMFGASSTAVAHTGVPIALDPDQRSHIIDIVRTHGGARCDLGGALRFIPRDDLMEPMYAREVPQLYLEIEQIVVRDRMREAVEVTAAVSFQARHEAYSGLQVTYVTFDPAEPDGLPRAAEWLNSVYVKEAYGGRILTDFDEQVRHFDEATFSLHRLLNGLIPREEALAVDEAMDAHGRIVETLERSGAIIMGDVYITGSAGAVGRNARAEGINITIGKGADDE